MSWHVVSPVTKRKLGSPVRRLVMITLANCADDDGTSIFPSIATLAAKAELSTRTVQRAVQEFLDEKLLVFVGQRPCRNGFTNEYYIDLAEIEKLEPIEAKPSKTRVGATGVTERRPKEKRVGDDDSTTSTGDSATGVTEGRQTGVTESDNSTKDSFSLPSKEGREKAPPSSKEKVKPHSMPEDWTPAPATRDYAKRLGFSEWEVDAAALECRDFWLDRPATKRPGWERTFQTRLRDLKEDPKARAKLKHVKPGAATVSEAEQRHRLQMFQDDGYWNDKWGPRPKKKSNGRLNGAHP